MKLSRYDIEKLSEVHALILKDLKTHYSISQLSRATGINRDKLKKGFKQHYGITVHEKLIEARMKLAMQLVIDTDKPIKEIAALTGYTYTSFITRFNKFYKQTPAAIRKA